MAEDRDRILWNRPSDFAATPFFNLFRKVDSSTASRSATALLDIPSAISMA